MHINLGNGGTTKHGITLDVIVVVKGAMYSYINVWLSNLILKKIDKFKFIFVILKRVIQLMNYSKLEMV